MQAKHALLAPSSAARRVSCPGSRALEERYPEIEESPHSREGEAAHFVAAEMLIGNQIGQYAPNGEEITQEMIEGAELYAHYIKPFGVDPKFIERKIDISVIHPRCWGTPDYFTWMKDDLYLFDYKYGHRFVEVFENWQLIEYAAGLLQAQPKTRRVFFVIIQPRCYHRDGKVRTWSTTPEQLAPYFETLRNQEALAAKPDALCTPNPECCDCRARHACEALQRSALTAVDVSTSNTPWELDAEQTGRELRYLKKAAQSLDARIVGLEEQAKYMIAQGQSVVGFRLEPSNGRERWKALPDEVIETAELFGIDVQKKKELITPTQARKLKLPEAVVNRLTQYYPGALKLTAIDENIPRKIFGGSDANF